MDKLSLFWKRSLLFWSFLFIPFIVSTFIYGWSHLFVDNRFDRFITLWIIGFLVVLLQKRVFQKKIWCEDRSFGAALIIISCAQLVGYSAVTNSSIGVGIFMLAVPIFFLEVIHMTLIVVYSSYIIWQNIKNNLSSISLKIATTYIFVLSLIHTIPNFSESQTDFLSLFKNTITYPVDWISERMAIVQEGSRALDKISWASSSVEIYRFKHGMPDIQVWIDVPVRFWNILVMTLPYLVLGVIVYLLVKFIVRVFKPRPTI